MISVDKSPPRDVFNRLMVDLDPVILLTDNKTAKLWIQCVNVDTTGGGDQGDLGNVAIFLKQKGEEKLKRTLKKNKRNIFISSIQINNIILSLEMTCSR